ncbi:MAG: cobalamin-dependent protein [Deltaproteobacteria bacterium]|nr:cobalamin-dependent protein [Deltaproteobacteria bacterium]
MAAKIEPLPLKHPVRIVSATSLFDGHDAAINLMRRLFQACGAEVIHLGHNRAVRELVEAAIQEDVQGIAVSSYQGGHNEYFRYLVDMLREEDAAHIRVVGGGGGVIRPDEVRALHKHGVAALYSADDGRRLGLQGMMQHLFERLDFPTVAATGKPRPAKAKGGKLSRWVGAPVPAPEDVTTARHVMVARALTLAEVGGKRWQELRRGLEPRAQAARGMIVGITGTGGAGKSSLSDELIRRFVQGHPERTAAVLSCDPTKRRSGGSLLGDRIRMNSVRMPQVYMRSFAGRGSEREVPAALGDAILVCKAAGFDLVFVETSGIGQADSAITKFADFSLYVMTAEYGAGTQLEKIEMLDLADAVVINKFERRGSEDALRDVRRQYARARGLVPDPASREQFPVFGTIASQFDDHGVNGLYVHLLDAVAAKGGPRFDHAIPEARRKRVTTFQHMFPPERVGYLREIAETCRGYRAEVEAQAGRARTAQALETAGRELQGEAAAAGALERKLAEARAALKPEYRALLDAWPACRASFGGEVYRYEVRGKAFEAPASWQTLSGTRIPRVATPGAEDHGELLRYLALENVPGSFPYTAGVFPLRRADEDPKRMFAGEGGPEKTNARFHYLCRGETAKRLSTAFDAVSLYGDDPAERLDIYGKVGEAGVSICSLDDMKKLYAGFELCDPNTSVSMTINGPAPMMLGMFFNTAIDQQLDHHRRQHGEPSAEVAARIRADVLRTVRGTVQADILKEDQAQNTCLFSLDFALRMMGDIQQWFIAHDVRNFYSVSISGYHIAEAGANPITQLAFTLANGFTYVEYYLSRGMKIDDFGPNLSFFFSNGMDAEYSVIGRVARRIWAVAMRRLYRANDRTQKLKYHIQTSGRSLHAQEVDFNDIRTTLQALFAIYDNCNSLHTNSYDEAITTPTEQSVRRAMAIQMIVNRELGLTHCENALQGSYVIEQLTDLVEEAVLSEFERLASRGGVLGAMEREYQRGKIQDESLLYEVRKHDGSLPLVGVNTYVNPATLEAGYEPPPMELRRSDPEEKQAQIDNCRAFQARDPGRREELVRKLAETAYSGGNTFDVMMDLVRVATVGQISQALYEIGGKYRRSM